MQATTVFAQTWDAIHAVNEDGSKKYKYIIHEGSSRSSKTFSLIQAFYLKAWQISNARFSVWRDTKKDCKDTVLNDMKKAFMTFERNREVSFHKTESIYTFPKKHELDSGTTWEICGSDDEEKVHGFEGDYLWLNECYNISRETFDQLDMRTKEYVFIDWNPKKSHWIDQLKEDPRAIVIKSTFKDNPWCPPEQRTKILSYQSIKFSDVVISGLITENDSRVYDVESNRLCLTEKQIAELIRCRENELRFSANDFNWNVYGLGIKGERPNRIYHFHKIPDEEYRKIPGPIYYISDWGKVDPWAVMEGKYYDGALYIHERNYLSENQIRAKLTPVELAQIQKDNEAGLVYWYWQKFNIPTDAYIICDPNRPLKILALRSLGYDYAIAAIKPPGSINDGISLVANIPVCYTASSENIEYEQENYSNKVDTHGVVLEDPADVNNHLMDDVRYLALFLQSQDIIQNI
jgi:phage terminase large subunit